MRELFKAEDYAKRRVTLYFGGKWKVVKNLESNLLFCEQATDGGDEWMKRFIFFSIVCAFGLQGIYLGTL